MKLFTYWFKKIKVNKMRVCEDNLYYLSQWAGRGVTLARDLSKFRGYFYI